MSSAPFFISTPRIETASTNGPANRNGSTGSVALFISNPITGSKIETISVIQSTTFSGGQLGSGVRYFVWLCDADGSNPIIIRDTYSNLNTAFLTGQAPTNTGTHLTFNFINGIFLGTNSSIRVGQFPYTDNRDPLHWVAVGADL